jgi:hypothetical protein
LSNSADTNDLETADGHFAREAEAHQPGYQPETVNVEGWEAPQSAGQRLFPGIVGIRCFLHVGLGIQQRCRSHPPLYKALTEDLWQLFHRLNPAQFGQRLPRLWEWGQADPEMPPVFLDQLAKLKPQAQNCKLTLDHPQAYRTSTQVDRLMNYQDRILYAMPYFHGKKTAAQQA